VEISDHGESEERTTSSEKKNLRRKNRSFLTNGKKVTLKKKKILNRLGFRRKTKAKGVENCFEEKVFGFIR